MSLQTRLEDVQERIERACERCGRSASEVTLVAVSKTVGADVVGQALALGQRVFGENRIEVMEPKAKEYPQAHWHFIGNIQKRKIASIVHYAELIHSVDRASIVPKINACAASLDRQVPVLLEVNVSGEESKSGFAPNQVADMLEQMGEYPNVVVKGLMTMAPQGAGPQIQATFAGLRQLKDRLLQEDFGSNVQLQELSMGMTEDFEEAIMEGATLVRIGRSIFSDAFDV